MALAHISAEALDVEAHRAAVESPATGAVVTFVGQVRNHSPDAAGEVVRLEYVGHPDIAAAITRLAEEVAAEFEDVALAVTHRTGTLDVGDAAICVAAGAAHREEAFAACRQLLEVVKARLPIWKKQVLRDGSHTWVGSA
ncbi:MAG TPA: molybdenum cofactor biosynthesis protein MoaE [Actinomycetaceae bacterium]|nr:molybdenum cofactor biosynthesis protein MoaE [Actinomycetaceae bacterium]